MTGTLNKILVDGWQRAHKLWSVRLAIFWGAVNGLYIALPGFIGTVKATHFAAVSIAFSIMMVIARLTKQPGLDDE